ncbi:DinB family protein [Amycolatopsis sp. NBC_01307]|uniref:DinB family protein n=1 Tax=Amycolatopsis sp. NBC_01307 TaxID=2903561 RepID=UPI002E10F720|nr:DinB family protein [Amycolatopsis sp. NBC_01307]
MTDPHLDLAARAGVADERALLSAFADNYRAIFRAKVSGLSEEDARRSPVPTGTSIGGLLKHLRWMEQAWFQRVLADEPNLPDRPAGEFFPTAEDTVESLLAEYDEQCETSRRIAAAHELSDTGVHHNLGEVTLRWIYVHVIEETARHAGQADIIREQLDGVTGPEI